MPKDKTSEALKSLNQYAFSSFAVTVLRFGIRILKNVTFARLLGPAHRGAYGLMTSLPDLLITFGDMGFGMSTTYLAAKRDNLRKITGNTLVMTLIQGLFLIGLAFGLLHYQYLLKEGGQFFLIYGPVILFTIPFSLLHEHMIHILLGTKRIHFINFLTLLYSLLPLALLILLWLATHRTLTAAMYAWTASIVIVSLIAVIKVLQNKAWPLGFSMTYMKEGLSFGLRSHGSSFCDAVSSRIDYLFIASFLGVQELGYYVISVSMAEILLSIPEAVFKPFLPIHLHLDREDAKNFAPIVIRHLLFIMIFVCAITAIFGKLLIWVLFGREFLPAYHSMLWLLPGIMCLSIYNLLKIDMYSRNLPGRVSLFSIVALVFNVISNLILIPHLGIVGAAMSYSFSYGLSSLFLLRQFVQSSQSSYRNVLLIKGSDLALLWNKVRCR